MTAPNLILVFLALLLHLTRTTACGCAKPSIQQQYFSGETDRYVLAKVQAHINTSNVHHHVFAFNVLKVFKGCPLPFFFATTASSPARCGVPFRPHERYLIPLPRVVTTLVHLSSCHVCHARLLHSHSRPAFSPSDQLSFVFTGG